MAEVEGIVGNARNGIGEGVTDVLRIGKTGGLVVGTAHGEHYEAASRGKVWSACTAVGGVAPGTSLSTTAAFWLHNPIGSGVNLSLIEATMGYLSGTLGAGSVYLTSHAGAAAVNPTGTAISPRQTLLGSSATGLALAFTTATVVTQIAIRPVCSFGAILATTAFQPTQLKDQINGAVIVPPGFGVGLHSIATAGTAPLALFGMLWEEIPIS